LLALEPYWLAMSPIVGMDGLLAGLVSASLLTMLVALAPPAIPVHPFDKLRAGSELVEGPPFAPCWSLASGLLTGLALLTKGPAIFLLLVVPLLAFESIWQAPRRLA